MLSIFLLLLSHCNGELLPWSWDTVPLWADFRTVTSITDYQTEFIGTTANYKLISLEKCLWGDRQYTEEAFYYISSKIRQYASSNETKIIFYWNTFTCYGDCYQITQNSILQNESMWLLDESGNPIYSDGMTTRPHYDHTQQYVRNWWINSLVSILKEALDRNITINGVFIDGLCGYLSPSQVSTERMNALNAAVELLLEKAYFALKELSNDFFILGNGLIGYSYQPNHCVHQLRYLDGIVVEHYGAFEEVDTSTGNIKPDHTLTWFNLSKYILNGTYGSNKSMFIKSWIGPESGTIDAMGPSWPESFGVRPSTYQGLQNASAELISFPLATYLCGIHNKGTYFSYAWWYQIHQGYVPCPDSPSCTCPSNWYDEFTNYLGRPLGDGVMYDMYKCNRSFEFAEVYVDINDPTSAQITWLTAAPSVDPTLGPTPNPTSTPTVDPTLGPGAKPTLTPTVDPTFEPTIEPTLSPTFNVEQRNTGAIIVAMFLIVLVVVTGCIGYSTWKYIRMQKNLEDVSDSYQAMTVDN